MTLEITSPQNPRIREVVRLRDRRGRQNQSRFIIDGLREIQRACAASLIIEEGVVFEGHCSMGAKENKGDGRVTLLAKEEGSEEE